MNLDGQGYKDFDGRSAFVFEVALFKLLMKIGFYIISLLEIIQRELADFWWNTKKFRLFRELQYYFCQ